MTDTNKPAAKAAPGYEDMLFALCNPEGGMPEEFTEADRRDVELFFRMLQQRKAQRGK